MAEKKARPQDIPKPVADPVVGDDWIPDMSMPAAKIQAGVSDEFDSPVALKFAFLGCGQAGGRMAATFRQLGYRRIGIVNTTSQDFAGIPDEIQRLDLGLHGACKEPMRAATEIAKREEELWDLLTASVGPDVDILLICAGLGGGSGTGMADYCLKVGREYMQRVGRAPFVGALVSLPMVQEGQKICENALWGMRNLLELKPAPLLLVDNGRVNDLAQKPGMGQMYARANTMTARLLHQFNMLTAKESGLMTFDRSELEDVLGQGITTLGVGALHDVKSPADVTKAIGEQLHANMLAEIELKSGTRAACIFEAGPEELDKYSVDFYGAGFDKLERMLNPAKSPVVHRGVYPSNSPGLRCYTMISGLDVPKARLAQFIQRAPTASSRGQAAYFGI